jgi:hypothetical protein
MAKIVTGDLTPSGKGEGGGEHTFNITSTAPYRHSETGSRIGHHSASLTNVPRSHMPSALTALHEMHSDEVNEHGHGLHEADVHIHNNTTHFVHHSKLHHAGFYNHTWKKGHWGEGLSELNESSATKGLKGGQDEAMNSGQWLL